MARYAAFLRGINVGGHKPIKMAELTDILTRLGLENVKTYIQSGNFVFDADAASATAQKIEEGLLQALGYAVNVMLRSEQEMQAIIARDPFAGLELGDDAKPYVTLLYAPAARGLTLPWFSPNRDVEVFAATPGELFSLSHPYRGRFGFPNAFIEKELDVIATTRNWNTMRKVAALAAALTLTTG